MAKKKKIKVTHKKLGREKAFGLAYADQNKIVLEERMRGKTYMETFIHEVMHVQNPEWKENMVLLKSKQMTEALWEDGFRWVDLKKR